MSFNAPLVFVYLWSWFVPVLYWIVICIFFWAKGACLQKSKMYNHFSALVLIFAASVVSALLCLNSFHCLAIPGALLLDWPSWTIQKFPWLHQPSLQAVTIIFWWIFGSLYSQFADPGLALGLRLGVWHGAPEAQPLTSLTLGSWQKIIFWWIVVPLICQFQLRAGPLAPVSPFDLELQDQPLAPSDLGSWQKLDFYVPLLLISAWGWAISSRLGVLPDHGSWQKIFFGELLCPLTCYLGLGAQPLYPGSAPCP